MDLLFDSTAIGWSLFALTVLLISFIAWFRYRFRKISQEQQFKKGETTILSRNKYPEVNIFKWSHVFFKAGLIASISFVILAFNWTSYEEKINEHISIDTEVIFDVEVPRTKDLPKPPPPPPPPPVKIEIPDEPIEDTVTFVDQALDAEEEIIATPIPEPQEVVEAPKPSLPPPPDPDEGGTVRIFAEQMPRFPGCNDLAGTGKEKDQCAQKKLIKFLGKNIDYPAMARENGIYGTAVIRFIVEKDGSLSNISILKDPGGGLGKEALRVVQLMNNLPEKWTPGKQNARPVRVQFNLPVRFRLQ
jgi:protein TonB